MAPWGEPAFDRVEIIQDPDEALGGASQIMHSSDRVFFTDGSAKISNLGAAVVVMGPSLALRKMQQIDIGPASHWNIHLAELIAIDWA